MTPLPHILRWLTAVHAEWKMALTAYRGTAVDLVAREADGRWYEGQTRR